MVLEEARVALDPTADVTISYAQGSDCSIDAAGELRVNTPTTALHGPRRLPQWVPSGEACGDGYRGRRQHCWTTRRLPFTARIEGKGIVESLLPLFLSGG